MTDLEQRLRDAFRDEADRLPTQFPETAPDRVRRRVRFRQATAVTSVTALAVGVAALVFLARGTFRDQPAVRPAESPTSADTTQQRSLVTEGTFDGQRWRYYLVPWEDGDWCTRVEYASGAGEACGISDRRGVMDLASQSFEPGPVFIEGDLSPEVARVLVELDDGTRVDAPIHRPPPELGPSFNLFIVVIDESWQSLSGHVTAFDRDGKVLEREKLPHRPPKVESPELPPIPREAELLASGVVRGKDWEILGFVLQGTDSKWCLAYRYPQGEGFNCGNDVAEGPLFAANQSAEGYPTLVYGAVSTQVSSVQVEILDGQTAEAQIVRSPGGAGVPFSVFWVLIEGEIPEGRVHALDEAGNLIASERLFVPSQIKKEANAR